MIMKTAWLFLTLFVNACAPMTDIVGTASPAQIPSPFGVVELPASIQARIKTQCFSIHYNGVRMHLVAYDDRDMTLRVADQPNGPGSRWITARDAAATYGGVAAINGGFFTPEGKPLGLLIETGTRRGHLNKSSLGTGIYLSSAARSAIIRRESYQKADSSKNPYNLLQSGPMLVDGMKPVSGLSKTQRRRRSFLAWDGHHHWAIGITEPCSLDMLANALSTGSLCNFKTFAALNLDGGRSSDLWVGSQVSQRGQDHHGYFNKAVRNYLVLTLRKNNP
jgi:uncharacterized protein YigE (DUF2233 family)